MADQTHKHESDVALHEALKQTFPASDPVTPKETEVTPSRPAIRKPAEVDKSAVDELAKRIPNSK
jgi:hypothetical protein